MGNNPEPAPLRISFVDARMADCPCRPHHGLSVIPGNSPDRQTGWVALEGSKRKLEPSNFQRTNGSLRKVLKWGRLVSPPPLCHMESTPQGRTRGSGVKPSSGQWVKVENSTIRWLALDFALPGRGGSGAGDRVQWIRQQSQFLAIPHPTKCLLGQVRGWQALKQGGR